MSEKKAIKKDDRHSHTGLSGSPKKGGAGGKGTWGTYKEDLNEVRENDHDPNYDSEEDTAVVIRRTEFNSPVEFVLREYLFSGDAAETAKSLSELPSVGVEQIVKKSIIIGLEHKAYERELISKLLSYLYSISFVSLDKMTEGFQLLLNSIEDLKLDNPDVVDVLAKYLARSIVDEIVPPAFLKTCKCNSSYAEEVVSLANGLASEKHRLDRLQHVWGPGDLSSVKRMKEEVILILEEFLSNGDSQEADKSIRKLNAPSFHIQVVRLAVRYALTLESSQRSKISSLLAYLTKEGLFNSDQVDLGFKSCHSSLKDIQLDIPNATNLFNQLVSEAKSAGYLPQNATY